MVEKIKTCGTVIKLDLQRHKDVGYIEVCLDNLDIRRILKFALEKLPEKTDYQLKCKKSVHNWLFDIKTDITIYPVLNKKFLKEEKNYKI